MSNNYVCRLCGKGSPVVFALSQSKAKTPLCSEDISKFIAANPSQAIYPIAAFATVNSASDMASFEESSNDMRKKGALIDSALQEADDEFYRASARLQEVRESAVEKLGNEFDQAGERLRCMHESVKMLLNLSKHEVELAKTRKDPVFTQVTRKLLTSTGPRRVPVYSKFISDVSKKLEKPVQSVLKFPFAEAEEFFQDKKQEEETKKSPAKEPVRKMEVPTKRPGEADEPPVRTAPKFTKKPKDQPLGKKPPSSKCEICRKNLRPATYLRLPDHESCLVCLKCIKDENHILLLCPVCRGGYSKESKAALEQKVPGLMAMLAENRQRKAVFKCDTCGTDTEMEDRHKCLEGKVRCIDCHEYLVATSCFRKKVVCPKCKTVPTELYQNLDPLECCECEQEMKLNEVAHWCEEDDYMVCGNCTRECECSDD